MASNNHDNYHPVAAQILVVEDESEQAFLLEQLLKMQGAQVTVAHTVELALENLGKGRFHMAFVDLRLVDGSGVEVLEALNKGHRETMPIIISGNPDRMIDALACCGGYAGMIIKPYSLHIIRRVMIMHRLPVSQ